MARPLPTMLVMAGGKGGVGRTTCALGLGAALGRDGRDALVVETDVRAPDLARRAGLDDDGTTPSRPVDHDRGFAAVTRGTPVREAARSVPGRPGLSVLERGGARPSTLPLERLEWPGPVVLDAPAGVGRPAARAIRAADHAMLVATPARTALRDAARTAAVCEALETPPAGALFTRCTDVPTVEPLLGCPAVATLPPAEEPLSDPAVDTEFDRLVARIG